LPCEIETPICGRLYAVFEPCRVPFSLETSMPGIFCAGDVRHDSIKRVSSGVGKGSMAIAFVNQYLALQKQLTGGLPTLAA